jgi:hemerythrin
MSQNNIPNTLTNDEKLIQNARERAKESALEIQVEKLIQNMSKHFNLEQSQA